MLNDQAQNSNRYHWTWFIPRTIKHDTVNSVEDNKDACTHSKLSRKQKKKGSWWTRTINLSIEFDQALDQSKLEDPQASQETNFNNFP